MPQENIYDLLIRVLQQIATDIVTLLPKLILVLVVIGISIIVIKLLNELFGKILKLVDLDKMFKMLVKAELPFSLNKIIIALIDIGIFLIALFGITNFFVSPQQMELMKGFFEYGVRIISVIAVVIFTFIIFTMLIERIRIETKMRGYVIFILLILVTMMVIDLTALSTTTKQALEQGLSIGLGIAVGLFALWFFFHEYLDKFLAASKK